MWLTVAWTVPDSESVNVFYSAIYLILSDYEATSWAAYSQLNLFQPEIGCSQTGLPPWDVPYAPPSSGNEQVFLHFCQLLFAPLPCSSAKLRGEFTWEPFVILHQQKFWQSHLTRNATLSAQQWCHILFCCLSPAPLSASHSRLK